MRKINELKNQNEFYKITKLHGSFLRDIPIKKSITVGYKNSSSG